MFYVQISTFYRKKYICYSQRVVKTVQIKYVNGKESLCVKKLQFVGENDSEFLNTFGLQSSKEDMCVF